MLEVRIRILHLLQLVKQTISPRNRILRPQAFSLKLLLPLRVKLGPGEIPDNIAKNITQTTSSSMSSYYKIRPPIKRPQTNPEKRFMEHKINDNGLMEYKVNNRTHFRISTH